MTDHIDDAYLRAADGSQPDLEHEHEQLDLDDLDALDEAPVVMPGELARVADPNERPEVRVTLEIHEVVEHAIAALSGSSLGDDTRSLRYTGHPAGGDPNLFERSNELVTVVRAKHEDAEHRTPVARGTPIIRDVQQPTLLERLTKYARFSRRRKPDKRTADIAELARAAGKPMPVVDKWEPCLPPAVITNALLARGVWRGIRPLVGTIETPFLRPDGTICQEPGYDESTGFLYVPGADFPNVDPEPTQDDARAALAELADVFCDFPYVDEAHKMVPVAALLTLLARAAIKGSVPAFLFDASTRGSGKTLQADVVSLIALGRFAARKAYPEEEEELEKVIASYAVAGTPMILLDNVTRQLGGGVLDLCLTARDTIELRVLGRTEVKRLPWNAIVCVSGNNLALHDDTMRRVLVARLESPLEQPEQRVDFKHANLTRHVLEHRTRLVQCALTVLRAYAVKGYPDAGVPRWGSFEEWSRLIPHALVYAGGADPMQSRITGDAAMSDDTRALATVLHELARLDADNRGMTSKEILQRLFPRDHHDDGPPDGWEAMREAVELLSPRRDARALGKRFVQFKGRLLNGRRLVRYEDTHSKVARWRVEGKKA